MGRKVNLDTCPYGLFFLALSSQFDVMPYNKKGASQK